MAADTRDITSVQQSPPPTTTSEHSSSRPYQGKVYEVFNGAPITPPENANVLPGGTANTAGGRTKDAGLIDAVRTMKLEEFGEIHKKPCVRDSLLTGIASGFGIGGLRAILGGMLALYQLLNAMITWTADH